MQRRWWDDRAMRGDILASMPMDEADEIVFVPKRCKRRYDPVKAKMRRTMQRTSRQRNRRK